MCLKPKIFKNCSLENNHYNNAIFTTITKNVVFTHQKTTFMYLLIKMMKVLQ